MPKLCEPKTQDDGYIAIPVSTLCASTVTGFALYLPGHTDGPMRLYRGADYPINGADIHKLYDQNVTKLYVAANAYHRYQRYLRENLPNVLDDETRPVASRFVVLNEVVRDVLREAFRTGKVDETVEHAKGISHQVVGLIARDDVVVDQLYELLHHDFHTFTHSVNVAYFSVMLAKALGISHQAELEALAMGALLHDLGKLSIPTFILNKPSKLDELEFEIIKQHPTRGFEQLNHRHDLSFGQLMMVYQHHERLDGSGYPVRCVGDEIHQWARLCAVTDVFEAMTSKRPYRAGIPLAETLSIIERQAGTKLDRDIVQCWKATITTR